MAGKNESKVDSVRYLSENFAVAGERLEEAKGTPGRKRVTGKVEAERSKKDGLIYYQNQKAKQNQKATRRDGRHKAFPRLGVVKCPWTKCCGNFAICLLLN